jgi:peroxiredoxin
MLSPTFLRSVAALALVFAACGGPSLAEVAVGQAAPEFRLKDLDGRDVGLADFKGRVVVLEWANPNCPFWRGHATRNTMTGVAAKHPQAVWLAIDSTNAKHGDYLETAAWKDFLAKHGIGYALLRDNDGATGRAYGARTTPHMFVIDAEGRIAYMGAIDDDPHGGAPKVNYADAALTALEQGAKPDPASTRPYGCSVKY